MKRIIPLLLACLLLWGCSTPAEPTESTTLPTTEPTSESTTETTSEPTTEPSTEPSTEPTTEPPVTYPNLLTGEPELNEAKSRNFAVTINNISQALPHRGISQADLFFEMFVNDYCTRGLALFSNVTQVPAIGSIRSTRYNFTDIAQAYNAVLCHAGGSDEVLRDLRASGVPNMLADAPIGFRDNARYKQQGYAWEHTLFAKGQSLWDAANTRGFNLELAKDTDYGMRFAEAATPANGTAASEVKIVFTLNGRTKTTTMKYDATLDKYIYNQYNKEMVDETNNEPEAFRNVIVILANVVNTNVYHVADLVGSGDGWFACGGKMIPIRWSRSSETAPFVYTLTDGSPLIQGIGSTYIAIAPKASPVTAS